MYRINNTLTVTEQATSNLENRQQQPNCRGYKIMKNAEMNKTKGMSMAETVLVLVKKNKYEWVITYLQVPQPGQL